MLLPIADRFVAGTTPEGAIKHTRDVNENGIATILNLLGEHYDGQIPANDDANAYLNLIDDIAAAGVDACISVKPSQIGIDISSAVFEENLGRIVKKATAEDVFCWVDMEDSSTTEDTLDAFERFVTEYSEMGLCLQANLKRTGEDLRRLESLPGKVRLVKGAYNEPAEIAYKEKSRVDEMYREHLDYLFREWDEGVAVGSHDPAMIEYATELHNEHGTDFEIQMLMGVRENAQTELAADYPVYQYAPYGEKWFSYFFRRIRERKENLKFALRAVMSR